MKTSFGRRHESPVAQAVWIVWTESGEYEDWSREKRGVFGSHELAEAYAAQLDDPEIEKCAILTEPPERGTYYHRDVFLLPNGKRGKGLAAAHNESWPCWKHEESRVEAHREPSDPTDIDEAYKLRYPDTVDLHQSVVYVEASGWDKEAVEAAFKREIAEARADLIASTRAALPPPK